MLCASIWHWECTLYFFRRIQINAFDSESSWISYEICSTEAVSGLCYLILHLFHDHDSQFSCRNSCSIRVFTEQELLNKPKITLHNCMWMSPYSPREFITRVVQFFGLSLCYGNQYIYQSMPRMLSLWLDYGAETVDSSSQSRNEASRQVMRSALKQLNKVCSLHNSIKLHVTIPLQIVRLSFQIMSQFCQRIAPYQFLTAFPQLISRICHTDPEVFAQLKVSDLRLQFLFNSDGYCHFLSENTGNNLQTSHSLPTASYVDDDGSIQGSLSFML